MMKKIFASLLFIYIFAGVFLYITQDNLLYHPTVQDFNVCEALSDYEVLMHNTTRFYLKRQGGSGALIFYHGNYGSACDRAFLKEIFEDSGKDVFFVEYAGYSNDHIKPSKNLILKDVENIVNFTKDYSDIMVIGASLGSGPASYHSSISNVDKMLLIAPYTSISDVAQSIYIIYPAEILVRDNYDNTIWLKDYQGKLLVVHGEEDSIISPKFSQKLYRLINTQNKRYVLIRGYGHNDIWDSKTMIDSYYSFIK